MLPLGPADSQGSACRGPPLGSSSRVAEPGLPDLASAHATTGGSRCQDGVPRGLTELYPSVRYAVGAALDAHDAFFEDKRTPFAPDHYASTVGLAMSIAIAHTAFWNELGADPGARRLMLDTLTALCRVAR